MTLTELGKLRPLKPRAWAVFLAWDVCARVGKRPKVAELAAMTALSETSIKRALAELRRVKALN